MKSQGLQSPGGPGRNLPIVRCPVCRMTMLTPGIIHGDTYECKFCRASFVVNKMSERVEQEEMKVDGSLD